MKKISPGIGNRAKRYRKPKETFVGFGKRIKRQKKSKRKHGRKRNKRKAKKNK
jgi:hypothetical protein